MLHLRIGEKPQKGDGGTGIGHEACAVGPVAYDQQPASQQSAGLNGKIDTFVGDQSR